MHASYYCISFNFTQLKWFLLKYILPYKVLASNSIFSFWPRFINLSLKLKVARFVMCNVCVVGTLVCVLLGR